MTTCIGCRANEVDLVLRKNGPERKERDVAVVRCAACGLSFLESWGESFDAGLYEYYAARLGQTRAERYKPLNTARHAELLAWIGGMVPGRRLLDVGCGEGHLIDSARALGWDARGIDLAEPAIQICQSFDLPCEVRDFFAPELDAERFDVVVMSELIEHVPEPARFLARAEELLTPGGVVYITTPNFDSLTRRAAGADWKEIHKEHLTYFTPRTLRAMVARSTRLEVLFLESRNVGVASIMARVRRARDGAPAPAAGGAAANANRAVEQDVRGRIERVPALRAAKAAMNRVLAATGTGDTMVALLRRI